MERTELLLVGLPFSLVIARTLAFSLMVPLGTIGVSIRWRVMLGCCLAILVAPSLSFAVNHPWTSGTYAVSLVMEIATGATLGLAVTLILTAVRLAGELIGQSCGLSLLLDFDQTNTMNAASIGRLFELLALAIFFLIGGHRATVQALLESFQWWPLGRFVWTSALHELLLDLTTLSLMVGLRIAAPTILALIAAAIVIGFVGRWIPQWNLIALGNPLSLAVGLTGASLTVALGAWMLQDQVPNVLQAVRNGLIP